MSEMLPRRDLAADNISPGTTVTRTKSKLTKTFADTTCVRTRSVTTTSRLGADRLVTKSTCTTTIRTKRAKVRVEPLGKDAVVTVDPLDVDPSAMLQEFVNDVEAEDAAENDDGVTMAPVQQHNSTPTVRTIGDEAEGDSHGVTTKDNDVMISSKECKSEAPTYEYITEKSRGFPGRIQDVAVKMSKESKFPSTLENVNDRSKVFPGRNQGVTVKMSKERICQPILENVNERSRVFPGRMQDVALKMGKESSFPLTLENVEERSKAFPGRIQGDATKTGRKCHSSAPTFEDINSAIPGGIPHVAMQTGKERKSSPTFENIEERKLALSGRIQDVAMLKTAHTEQRSTPKAQTVVEECKVLSSVEDKEDNSVIHGQSARSIDAKEHDEPERSLQEAIEEVMREKKNLSEHGNYGWDLTRKMRKFPEGRSYKEMYFDNVCL